MTATPTPASTRHPVRTILGLAAVVGLVAVILALTDTDSSSSGGGDTPAAPAGTALEGVYEFATTELDDPAERAAFREHARLGDNGHTLILDGAGDDSDGLTVEQIAGILVGLGVPESVTAQMDGTRALDGRQSASWDRFEVSWTYHPDAGFDAIVTER